MSEKRKIRGDNVNRKSRDVNFFYESGCVEITFDHISVVWSDGNNKGNYIAYLSESLNRFTKNKKKLHKERHKTNTAKTLQQTHINSCKQKKNQTGRLRAKKIMSTWNRQEIQSSVITCTSGSALRQNCRSRDCQS